MWHNFERRLKNPAFSAGCARRRGAWLVLIMDGMLEL